MDKDTQIWDDLHHKINTTQEYWSNQYDQIKADLEFLSGDQWDRKDLLQRKGRPALVSNFAKTLINRVVNPIRMAPYGIDIGGEDVDATAIIQAAIRDIEQRSDAAGAYETALECAATAGVGFIHIKSEYIDNDSLEQRLVIDTIDDPAMIYIDPGSKKSDGSDAQFAFIYGLLDKAVAKERYPDASNIDIPFNGKELFKRWQLQKDQVPYVTFYKIVETTKKKYWLSNGETITEDDLNGIELIDFELESGLSVVAERPVTQKAVDVYTIVGNSIVDTIRLEMPYIPIVPVYGDNLYLPDDGLYYSGIIRAVKDSQRMVNLYLSLENELISSSPKSQWVAAFNQLEGLEHLWGSDASPEVLMYQPTTDKTGQHLLPPPQRIDNRAQTDWVLSGRAANTAEMGRAAGIFDPMLGGLDDGTSQAVSGRAVHLRQAQGEIATAQYTDNMLKSLKQVGRVVLSMIPIYYDTIRQVPMRDKEGNISYEKLNLAELVDNYARYDVRVSAGPMLESRKQAALQGFQMMAQILPQKAELIADYYFEALDTPEAHAAAKRFRKLLPPELRDESSDEGVPDPEAIAALETAQDTINGMGETIKQMEAYIANLQAKIINDSEAREAKLTEAIIKANTQLTLEQMKQEGQSSRDLAKLQLDAEKTAVGLVEKAIEKEEIIVQEPDFSRTGVNPLEQSVIESAQDDILAVLGDE